MKKYVDPMDSLGETGVIYCDPMDGSARAVAKSREHELKQFWTEKI